MRPISKDPQWKNNFKNASQSPEKCGESMVIFVNVKMYVSKSCAAISGEFLKSSKGIHMNFPSMFLDKQVPKILRRLFLMIKS